jgi:hypothetical protein
MDRSRAAHSDAGAGKQDTFLSAELGVYSEPMLCIRAHEVMSHKYFLGLQRPRPGKPPTIQSNSYKLLAQIEAQVY